MADHGTSTTADKHKRTSWITVLLITLASIVLGFAFVFTSVPLTIIGALIGLVGLVLGITGKIMDDAH